MDREADHRPGVLQRGLEQLEEYLVQTVRVCFHGQDRIDREVDAWRPVCDRGLQPIDQTRPAGLSVTFSVSATGTAPLSYQWRKDLGVLSDAGSISGTSTPSLTISPLIVADAGSYDCVVTNACGSVNSVAASLTVILCPADLDDGTGSGTPNGGIDVNDLLYFLDQFQAGSIANADLDNGTGTGTPDGGVDVNDLLYFLDHFQTGC